jgi:Carboxypeptidase regulatory-like domain
MLKGLRYVFCIAVLIAGGALLIAQVGTQGSILGTVIDASGAGIPGADIVVTNLETGLTSRASTDSTGNFEILALPIGRYSVAVSAKGFKTTVASAQSLRSRTTRMKEPCASIIS